MFAISNLPILVQLPSLHCLSKAQHHLRCRSVETSTNAGCEKPFWWLLIAFS